MWQIYAMQALELARERQREADAVRLARSAVTADVRPVTTRRGRSIGARFGWVGRRLVVGGLRRIGAGAGLLADAACAAASRLERGAA
jgi:hypothetical protein